MHTLLECVMCEGKGVYGRMYLWYVCACQLVTYVHANVSCPTPYLPQA